MHWLKLICAAAALSTILCVLLHDRFRGVTAAAFGTALLFRLVTPLSPTSGVTLYPGELWSVLVFSWLIGAATVALVGRLPRIAAHLPQASRSEMSSRLFELAALALSTYGVYLTLYSQAGLSYLCGLGGYAPHFMAPTPLLYLGPLLGLLLAILVPVGPVSLSPRHTQLWYLLNGVLLATCARVLFGAWMAFRARGPVDIIECFK